MSNNHIDSSHNTANRGIYNLFQYTNGPTPGHALKMSSMDEVKFSFVQLLLNNIHTYQFPLDIPSAHRQCLCLMMMVTPPFSRSCALGYNNVLILLKNVGMRFTRSFESGSQKAMEATQL